MSARSLTETAQALVAVGKGILAADESAGTIANRFQAIGLPSTEETRRAYREMLFTTPDLGKSISGVILFDETIRQKSSRGEPFPDLLRSAGMIPGIKVDHGAKPLAGFPHETITEGLDGLRERFAEYQRLGARFSKWRAVISIGPDWPTRAGMRANAHALARFASLSQEAGLVPIVEPEVLMDGAHSLDRCAQITAQMLRLVFDALADLQVTLEGMLLKPNMIVPGEESSEAASVAEVAERTVMAFKRVVPAAVPGIVFLSGGQSDILATQHLNAMNQLGPLPWPLSFSYGRALQAPALRAWNGSELEAGQLALQHRARCNSAARFGHYSDALEKKAA